MRASQRSRAKYPLSTISVYGPDNRRATKLLVGILRDANQKDPNPLRSWSTDAEPFSGPVAKMSPDEVLIDLAKDRATHPLEAPRMVRS
jgi:hypothetical protein